MKDHPAKVLLLMLTTILLGMVVLCSAQRPFQYKYSANNGLPLVEAELIRFSRKGEVWVTYSAGEYLSRFDGINWTHYRFDSIGLLSKLVILNEDIYGLWFSAPTNQSTTLVRFTPDEQWKTYKLEGYLTPYFDTDANCLKLLGDSTYSFAYDPHSDTFARSKTPLIPNAGVNSPEQYYGIYHDSNKQMYLAKWLVKDDTGVFYFGQNFKDTLCGGKNHYHAVELMKGKFVVEKNGQFFWHSGGKSKELKALLPDGSIGDAIFWVPLYKWEKGPAQTQSTGFLVKHPSLDILYLYGLHDDGSMALLLSHLDGDVQKFFAQDPQGNWWYTTSSGVVRTDRSQLVFDERNPDMVNGLHTIGQDATGNIWFGGYNGQGGFSVFDGQRLQRQFFSKKAIPVLPGAYLSSSGSLYFFTEGDTGLCSIRDGKFTSQLIPNLQTGFYICSLSGGKIGLGLFGSGLGIAEEINGTIAHLNIVEKDKGMLLDNVLTIAEDKGHRLWMGRTTQGIAIYDTEQDTAVTWLRSPDNSIGARSACVDENGTLWLGTNDGIYQLPNAHLFDYTRHDLFSQLKKLLLPGPSAQSIYALLNTELYLIAGTPEGLYFLDKKYHGKRPRIFSMLFDKDIAGQGAEQNALMLDRSGRHLWIGTNDGATRLDLDLLRFDTSATTLRLDRFTAGGDAINITKGQIGRLPVKKRNITLAFSPIGNSFLKDDIYFDITIINERGDTLFERHQTKEQNCEMPYLIQGTYTLHIVAYKHNVMSGQAIWQFIVPRLLSENPWVWGGLALIVLGVPFTYFYLKKRHQAELERSRREQDALQIRALSNFFNPHFINNSLHWVQSRYRKDPDTATIVGRLSQNVDLLFENTQSGKAFHPLKKELEIVRNYLKIQQVRFGEGLQVSLNLPKSEEALNSVQVPSMLLQIHTENAVEKGIRNRKGAGHFSLSVNMQADGCHITIEDDGRGRYSTPSDRKGSTTVMDDLVALFNRYNRKPLAIHYDDLVFTDTNEERYGTRVHFFIPKNYTYELS